MFYFLPQVWRVKEEFEHYLKIGLPSSDIKDSGKKKTVNVVTQGEDFENEDGDAGKKKRKSSLGANSLESTALTPTVKKPKV